MRHVLGPDPRAVVLDDERGAAGAGPHGDPDAPIDRAVADRVVDQDHDELSKPRRVAGDDGRLRVDEDVDAAIGRRLAHGRRAVGGDVAEVDRHVLQRDRARVRPGEQKQVLDDGGHVGHLVVDVDQRRADLRDGLVTVSLEVVDTAADDGQRRPQLVAGVRGELALPPQRHPLGGQRFADRDQRPPRVDRPEAERHQHHQPTADDQHDQHRVERALLGDAIADDLDRVCRAAGRDDVLGQDPNGCRDGLVRAVGSEALRCQGRRPDVPPLGPRRGDARHVGQPGRHVEATRREDIAAVVDRRRDRARAATAEDEAVRARVVGFGPLPGQARADLVET